METKTANINPTNFRGTVSENADTWLRYLIKYCAYKGYNDERSKALFKVLLTESAAVWFDSLQQDTQTDWPSLKTAFLARFTTPEFMKYKHANELFNSKQGDRSADDFCAYMQNLVREVEADEHMLIYAAMNGLNNEIKNHVTRSQPNTWKDLVDAAKVGEMCVPEAPSNDSSVTVQLELIKDQLKHLFSAQGSPVSASLCRQEDRPYTSPSPRRVHFNDWTDDRSMRYDATRRDDYADYPDRRIGNGRRFGYDRSISAPRDFSFRGRWVTRGPRYNRPMGPPTQWRNDGYQNQPIRGTPRGRGTFRGSVRPPQLENSRDRQWPEPYGPSCEKCGRWRHEHPNMCPAINQDCRGCGRKGHFLKVCRSTVHRDVMSD